MTESRSRDDEQRGVPRGVPASGAGAFADMVAAAVAAGHERPRQSVTAELIAQRFENQPPVGQRFEIWVEDNSMAGGRWVLVEDV